MPTMISFSDDLAYDCQMKQHFGTKLVHKANLVYYTLSQSRLDILYTRLISIGIQTYI